MGKSNIDSSVLKWGDRGCGIYKLTNIITGDSYIGSSTKLKDRRSYHMTSIEKKAHENYNIQKACSLYTSADFTFEIIELFKFPVDYSIKIKKEHLYCREVYYIQSLRPTYNLDNIGSSYCNLKRNYSDPAYSKRKRSEISLVVGKVEKPSIRGERRVRTIEERVSISRGKRNATGISNFSIGMYNRDTHQLIQRFPMPSVAAKEVGIGRSSIANNLAGLSSFCKLPDGVKVIFKKL